METVLSWTQSKTKNGRVEFANFEENNKVYGVEGCAVEGKNSMDNEIQGMSIVLRKSLGFYPQ
jgi:hypothetical protein